MAADAHAARLREARQRAGLTLRAAAQRAGTSHATLAAYEQGRKVPGVTTYFRLLDAYGFAPSLELEPRIREVDGYARGEELLAVLELAEQFPARHSRKLRFPRFAVR